MEIKADFLFFSFFVWIFFKSDLYLQSLTKGGSVDARRQTRKSDTPSYGPTDQRKVINVT